MLFVGLGEELERWLLLGVFSCLLTVTCCRVEGAEVEEEGSLCFLEVGWIGGIAGERVRC